VREHGKQAGVRLVAELSTEQIDAEIAALRRDGPSTDGWPRRAAPPVGIASLRS